MSELEIKKAPRTEKYAGASKSTNQLSDILQRASQVVGIPDLHLYAKKNEKPRNEPSEPVVRRAREKKRKRSNQAKAKKVRAANLRVIAKLKQRLSHIENARPKLIPSDVWMACKVIVSDRTGRAIAEYSSQTSNKIALSRIHRAALSTSCSNAKVYSYRGDSTYAVRARRIFALGYLLIRMSHGTRRKGQYNRLVAGIPQTAMISAIESPFERRSDISRSTLTGRHRNGGKGGETGYLTALKHSGFCYSRQAKWRTDSECSVKGWGDIRPEEIAGSRGGWSFSLGRYWLITEQFTAVREQFARQKLWADMMSGYQPLDAWLSCDAHGKTSGLCPKKPPAKPPD